MQAIISVSCCPEQYAADNLQRQVRPPGKCQACGREHGFKAHGYYDRNTSDTDGRAISILVRRFRCRTCRGVVSCLPSFAQPYRFVNSLTIQHFFAGETALLDVRRNCDSLRRYRKTFDAWKHDLQDIVSPTVHTSRVGKPIDLWQTLMIADKTLETSTCRLVRDFRATCFGRYRCHQPRKTR